MNLKSLFFLGLVLKLSSVWSQELFEYEEDTYTNGVGLSVRSFDKKRQTLMSSFNIKGTGDFYYDASAAISIDGVTFNDEENEITLGVKAGFNVIDYDEGNVGGGIDVDVNKSKATALGRIFRAVRSGKNTFVHYGAVAGFYKDYDLDNAFENFKIEGVPESFKSGETFAVGINASLATNIKIGKSSTLQLSGRGDAAYLPLAAFEPIKNSQGEITDRKSYNGALVMVSLQALLKTKKISVFVSNRNDYVKVKNYYKKTGYLTAGIFIPISAK